MGTIAKHIAPFLFLLSLPCFAIPSDGKDPNKVWEEMWIEIATLHKHYLLEYTTVSQTITLINQKISTEKSVELKLNLLIEKDQLKDYLEILKTNFETDVTKIRYLKGMYIIRLLYDKSLSLDHHFSSVRTFSEINKMANPNQYPEFDKLKELVSTKKDKKNGFDLTAILGTNTLVSVINTFSNLLVANLSKEEKEKELTNIECILDFTLRMQNDLNTIYFETSFLQKSNEKIKEDIEILFKEYTKPIGYTNTLDNCRANDEWDILTQKMNEYLLSQKKIQGPMLQKMIVNMEFPVDRLIQFIGQYNNFIDLGGKFYEKFKIILNSYENEKQCETKLPLEYKKLKADIDVAIEKFNKAYKPVEINGSKMKELLYGLNEFE
ncbi:MAG: hypothetical protein V4648_02565 [Bacteroidota bacterium]